MRLKICGITREEDALEASRLGFQLCGFVFHASSPRHMTMERAAALHSGAMLRTGVFVNQELEEIRAIMSFARLDYAQLHGGQSQEMAQAIGLDRVIRVLWPARYDNAHQLEADAASKPCAFYLLESGVKGGGSGEVMNWGNLRGLRLPAPFFLAGGLSPQNVAQAAQLCKPDGMDINSGVEKAPGVKDHKKMAAVAAALRGR